MNSPFVYVLMISLIFVRDSQTKHWFENLVESHINDKSTSLYEELEVINGIKNKIGKMYFEFLKNTNCSNVWTPLSNYSSQSIVVQRLLCLLNVAEPPQYHEAMSQALSLLEKRGVLQIIDIINKTKFLNETGLLIIEPPEIFYNNISTIEEVLSIAMNEIVDNKNYVEYDIFGNGLPMRETVAYIFRCLQKIGGVESMGFYEESLTPRENLIQGLAKIKERQVEKWNLRAVEVLEQLSIGTFDYLFNIKAALEI